MSRYAELAGKVDAFFARVWDRHGGDMACARGCSDCCAAGLTVTGAEADAIRAEVAGWAPDQRADLARSQLVGCAALDAQGRCRIYAARPIVCRSHGAPIRMRDARSLPVVQACEKNFRTTTPDADCVLDQTTLSAMTLAVDRDAGGDGTRTAIAELLAQLAR